MMFFWIFGLKGVYLDFFGFFKIRKLFWNQNRHIWGVKEKEEINLTTLSAFKMTFFGFLE